jgi:hypothetical protein
MEMGCCAVKIGKKEGIVFERKKRRGEEREEKVFSLPSLFLFSWKEQMRKVHFGVFLHCHLLLLSTPLYRDEKTFCSQEISFRIILIILFWQYTAAERVE